MANKALKWADRLWKHGEEFIENLGLKSWFLDNYPFAKAENNEILFSEKQDVVSEY